MASSLRRLRAGDWVVVRSKEEILATLDDAVKLDGLPFMPEMLDYCGRRLRVAAVAHKTCDPAHKTGGRRMKDAVHLEDLRCSGGAHGGCQASCLLFWKIAWLKSPEDGPKVVPPARIGRCNEDRLRSATVAHHGSGAKPVYVCQATCLFGATQPLGWWNVSQYLRDLSTRNVPPSRWLAVLLLAWLRAALRLGMGYRVVIRVYRRVHARLLGLPVPEGSGEVVQGESTPIRNLGLQPGEWVRARSQEDIRTTLTTGCRNRGMWFDDEMVPYCGGTYRVAQRVERIIHEVSGEMIEMKTPCITLDGVVCRSQYSRERLFCPRRITPYWREIWLERMTPPPEGASVEQDPSR